MDTEQRDEYFDLIFDPKSEACNLVLQEAQKRIQEASFIPKVMLVCTPFESYWAARRSTPYIPKPPPGPTPWRIPVPPYPCTDCS